MSRMSELYNINPVEKEPCTVCEGDKSMILGSMTLEQLSGEDYYIWVKHHPKFGYNVTLESEDEKSVCANGVHPDAMESFATLCRTFIRAYDQCQES